MLLIVEDDPHYARIMVDLARDHGLKVLVAARGAEALALARQYQPTAISLDVFLPDMLGWTVLSQLKQDATTRHIPVQIVTLDEDRQHGLARGAFSFISKPTTTEGLKEALARITDFARPHRKRLLLVEDNAGEQLGISRTAAGQQRRHRRRRNRRGGDRRTPARADRLRGARPAAARHVRLQGAGTPARRPDPVRRTGGRVHRPRAVVGRGRAAAHHGPQRRGQGGRIAGAAARRDRLVPASRRRRHAGRQAAHAGAAAQFRRKPGRPQGAAGRRRRTQHLRPFQRAGTTRDGGADGHHGTRGDLLARGDLRRRDRADGHHDAGDGRLRDHGA